VKLAKALAHKNKAAIPGAVASALDTIACDAILVHHDIYSSAEAVLTRLELL
jgi:hypothetical protein